MRHLLERVAGDPRFQIAAGLGAYAKRQFLEAFADAETCYSSLIQGGYAGRRPPPGRKVVLALSPQCLRLAAAAHELLHLARDVLGRTALDADLAAREILVEEFIVWNLTVRYRPFRGCLELALQLAAYLGLPSLLIYHSYLALTG